MIHYLQRKSPKLLVPICKRSTPNRKPVQGAANADEVFQYGIGTILGPSENLQFVCSNLREYDNSPSLSGIVDTCTPDEHLSPDVSPPSPFKKHYSLQGTLALSWLS